MSEIMISNLAGYVDRERISENVLLKDYTTFKVGGPAKIMIKVDTVKELCDVIAYLNKCQATYMIIGNGSNLLVSDEGYDGIVIKLEGDFTKVETKENVISAGSGTLLVNVCKEALNNSLTGLEFAYGIPGTVGGAIVMNAGAFEGEMSMVVTGVEAVTKEGELIYVAPHSLRFGYRRSEVRKTGLIVTKVDFTLTKGDREAIENKMNELKNRRVEKQPLEYPSAGSTFKRPEGYFAGKLISEAGLSGERIGGACVSPKHNGFIINDAGATAKDVNDLIELVKKRVYDTSNVKLEPEVIKVGRF